MGYHLPRTISSAITTRENDDPEPFRISDRERYEEVQLRQRYVPRNTTRSDPQDTVFRIGGSVIPPQQNAADLETTHHPPHLGNQLDLSTTDNEARERKLATTDKSA